MRDVLIRKLLETVVSVPEDIADGGIDMVLEWLEANDLYPEEAHMDVTDIDVITLELTGETT